MKKLKKVDIENGRYISTEFHQYQILLYKKESKKSSNRPNLIKEFIVLKFLGGS
jgi:hypothetical protein